MKIRANKDGVSVTVYDMTAAELIHFLKVQLRMQINFVTPGKEDARPVSTFYLLSRTIENYKQKIVVAEKVTSRSNKLMDYEELIKFLKTYINSYACEVVVTKGALAQKRPLIAILDKINDDLMKGCVYLDYDDGMFSVVNKPIGNKPNEIYYWEDSNSLFIFSNKGPKLIYQSDKFDSIEDIICQ